MQNTCPPALLWPCFRTTGGSPPSSGLDAQLQAIVMGARAVCLSTRIPPWSDHVRNTCRFVPQANHPLRETGNEIASRKPRNVYAGAAWRAVDSSCSSRFVLKWCCRSGGVWGTQVRKPATPCRLASAGLTVGKLVRDDPAPSVPSWGSSYVTLEAAIERRAPFDLCSFLSFSPSPAWLTRLGRLGVSKQLLKCTAQKLPCTIQYRSWLNQLITGVVGLTNTQQGTERQSSSFVPGVMPAKTSLSG